MSSPWHTQDAQASVPSATPQPQISESPAPAPAVDSPTTTRDCSVLVSPAGGPSNNATSPIASTPTIDADSTAAVAVTAPTTLNPPTPKALHGSANEPLHDAVQAKFVSSAGYVVHAPSFSYNVFPRANSTAGSPQQSATTPALKLSPPMSAAALQPPVPGQPFVNRPSFSYNVSQHANASSASAQQFRPATASNQMQLQGLKLTPPQMAASLQPPVPGQLMRPSLGPTGAFAQGIPRPLGQLATSSNFSFGESAKATSTDSSDKRLTPKEGTPNVVASEAGNSTVESVSSQSVKTSIATPTSSSTNSTPIPNSSYMLAPTSTSLKPPSGISVISGAAGHLPVPNSVAIQPRATDSFSSPLRPIMPPPTAPLSFPSVPLPHPQNIQQQIYSPYPSVPVMAPTPQAPWLHPPLAGSVQHAPFYQYPGVFPSPFPVAVRGMSVPSVPSASVQPPGVSPAVLSDVSKSAEATPASNLTAGSLPLVTDHDKPVAELHKDGGAAVSNELDAWTSHKTESGTIYYYNSITGESTYDKPSGFKGEPEKVADQSTPVTWDKIDGTNWTLITTNDGKKYYYDTKNKVSSWQIPSEVTAMRKDQENDSLKANKVEEENTGTVIEKVSAPVNINTPAVNTGGRDSVVIRSSGGQVSSSALDLIKKKLHEGGTPGSPTPATPLTTPTTEPNGSKAVETAKGQQSINSKDKLKDANGEGNMSDSSSESDDEESGPTKEECIIQFKEMLKERGVAPFSKWDKELPKIVFDPRFKAVPSYSVRRSIFEHYVRTRAEEERKEKRAAQKAVVDGFKQLLEEASEDIDHKTDYQTFRRKWGKDPRFAALDRKERELLLNEKVLPLKKAAEDKDQAIRAAAVTRFTSMLRENRSITVTSRWSKVKDSLRSDPRYRSVKHEEREVLFNEYISELKAAEDDAERAAKAKRDEHDKLKERERETRKRKEREEQEMERIRQKVRRKEAISSYQALLVETIKDPKASWTESKTKLEKDPQGRATNPDLSETDMEKQFRDHVKDLFERCARDYRYLLAEVITMEAAAGHTTDDGKNVLNSWTEAKRLLKPDPRYSKMPRKEREALWNRHAEDLLRKHKAAADPKETPKNEGRDKSTADFSRRSPRRSHGRR